jgi:hypothetical protein
MVKFDINNELDLIRAIFDEEPDEQLIFELESAGFTNKGNNKIWVSKNTIEATNLGRMLLLGELVKAQKDKIGILERMTELKEKEVKQEKELKGFLKKHN